MKYIIEENKKTQENFIADFAKGAAPQTLASGNGSRCPLPKNPLPALGF